MQPQLVSQANRVQHASLCQEANSAWHGLTIQVTAASFIDFISRAFTASDAVWVANFVCHHVHASLSIPASIACAESQKWTCNPS